MKRITAAAAIVLLFGLLSNIQGQDRTQDSLNLVLIYNSTGGPNWVDTTNWLSAEPIDTWFGVTVSNNRVSELKIIRNNLTGVIPVEIGNLTSLTKLTLSSNQLSGTIPVEIGNLSEMKFLYLLENQLSGTIPVEIGKLTKLNQLLLNDNQLTGSIPDTLGNLTNLTILYLYNNEMSGTIPAEIGNITKLRHLRFHNNQLSGTIPAALANLTNLATLYLYSNQLSGSIPAEIWTMTNLTDLRLDQNMLNSTIPPEAGNLTNLKSFNIKSNDFTELANLSSLTALSSLFIQENKFTFEDIEPNMNVSGGTFIYAPQDSIGSEQDSALTEGASYTLSVGPGGTANKYQWFKNSALIPGAEDSTYIINSFAASDSGSYTCEITNTIATELTLTSRPVRLSFDVSTDIISGQEGLPGDFNLHANYPNPFNPSTTIQYDLPQAAKVTLTLYNSLGQRVRVLINGNQAAGVHRYNLNAVNLPSGTYFYKIKAGGFSAVRRMVLIK